MLTFAAFNENNMAFYEPAWTNKIHIGLSRASGACLQHHTARRRNGRNSSAHGWDLATVQKRPKWAIMN